MKSKSIKFILANLRPLLWWVLFSLAVVALATLVGRSKMYLLKLMTDTAYQMKADPELVSNLWTLLIVYSCAHFAGQTLWRSSGFAGMQWITKIKANIIQNLFDYISKHSLTYFNNRFAGALATKIGNVQSGLEFIAANVLWMFFPLFVGLIADFILLKDSHIYLSTILVAWMSVFLVTNILAGLWLKKYFYESADANSKLKGKIIDSSSNIASVQYAPGMIYESSFVSEFVGLARKKQLNSWYRSEWILFINAFLLTLFVILMIGFSIQLYSENLITIGSIVLVITIIISLERSLFHLGEVITRTLQNYGQIEEALDDILVPHDIVDVLNAKALVITEPSIKIENVTFAYNEKAVIRDLNLEITSGEKIGIVGVSGAGKSTLVALMLRQFELSAGRILISNQNIADVKLDSLREAIAFVPQGTELFHRPIIENIRYGKFDATEEEVFRAAELAYASEFIQNLPQKYQTYVGERGVKLSGGQRQRIAIARAILKDAPILILDEATSALDTESEIFIQNALNELMKNKTVIAIAHRLSTLQIMDKIIVMDDGQFVESGTHEELLKLKGRYAEMWENQVSGFLVE